MKVERQKVKSISWNETRPISIILLKLIILSSIIFCGLLYSDSEGYFNPDNKYNHTVRKWNSFYEFTKENDVDILLIGNSHLYTGINPENLSSALGCNSFMLASPGTTVIDNYFALKEALKLSKPKLVIIETYGLKKSEQLKLSAAKLSDQFKSFFARKNISLKIESTPAIFAVKNYPYAWSNTLRNHDYILSNYSQIEKNIQLKELKTKKGKKLYLGHFTRFRSGIADSTLKKYKSMPPPVNGLEFETNKKLDIYIQKIIQLCKINKIELAFLTLPMYKEHISNYAFMKEKLEKSLGDYANKDYWLDLQIGKGYSDFSKHHFENTLKKNQHMTYSGSLLATCKLIDFIKANDRIKISSRRVDDNWRNLIYGVDGFFEYNSPKKDDSNNLILYTGSKKQAIEEILVLKRDKYYSLIAKCKSLSPRLFDRIKSTQLRLRMQVKKHNGERENIVVNLPIDILHSNSEKINFKLNVKPIDIIKIDGIKLINL